MNGVLVLPVGPPGCGKTHFGDTLFHADAILRLDDYRRVMCGDENDDSADESAVGVRAVFLWERLRHGLPVYADATNARAEYRSRVMVAAREFSRPVIAVWWRVGVNECMLRQRDRERQVEREVVERIHSEIEAEADDLRATTHLRIEFDEAGSAALYISALGRTLRDLPLWMQYAQELVARYNRFQFEPVKVVFDPDPATDPGRETEHGP